MATITPGARTSCCCSRTPLPPLQLQLLIAALLFALLAAPGAALHCWVCQSNNDPQCADPFNNATLQATNCSLVQRLDGEARFCSKMRSEVNGKTVIFRSCSDKEGLCPNVEHAGFCSTCKKDYCNGAGRPGGPPSSIMAAAAAAAAVAATAKLIGPLP